MERIKNMPLKRALFALALINLLTATFFSILAFWTCMELSTSIEPYGEIMISLSGASPILTKNPDPSPQAVAAVYLLSTLQIALPILFFVAAMLLTASLFYRWKLKEPLEILTKGAERIMKNDLDFPLPAASRDELGQLCHAFETMRQSLLQNNRRLWQQTEERKRLNAAFSHDLRNPVTVLKGSVKLAKQLAEKQQPDPAALLDHLTRMDLYTDRIARYVETMSSVQRLEQLQPQKSTVDPNALSDELEKALRFAAQDFQKQLTYSFTAEDVTAVLDKNMLFQIAENLTANALRFAGQTVSVKLFIQSDTLTLTVADDGGGFDAEFLKNGIQPFSKGTGEAEHFGMGLYICDLLCQKHGGALQIENGPEGAVARAVLKIS